MQVRVECYSGYKADERPVRVYMGERVLNVEEVTDQWYGPDDTWFRVRGDDGGVYVLRRREVGEGVAWTVESFRQA